MRISDWSSDVCSSDLNNTIENVQVTLPPSIKASHPYRCGDNSAVTIDFLSDDVTINLRSEGPLSQLKAPAPGEAVTDGRHTGRGDGPTKELHRPAKKPGASKMGGSGHGEGSKSGSA